MGRLEGQVAIVTGGGKGIGRAVAESFAAAGAAVVIAARSRDDVAATTAAITAAGGRAIAVAGDVAAAGTAEALVKATEDHFGGCDILINAAAIQGPIEEVETLAPAMWEETLRINVTGTFLTCRAVVPAMKARGGGRIVNVSSGLATRVLPGHSAYSASKAAVVQFTRVLAEEVRPAGILANVVHPGIVRTGMVAPFIGVTAEGPLGRLGERMTQLQASGSIIEPDQSARLFLWLAAGCERSGDFIRIDDPAVVAKIDAYLGTATASA